ncbi:phosphate transport system substrate-binding protein [Arcanobacterium wilhelmae]|uniref:Phosphate-binding protein n=1 Tax=Arcanobacterium wilhelmae TaxID=1803177 RepID=A0ABT9NAE4_9ACTO|nr:phosphate ABC transporter substrate-binding protein PstS [Arcanobacterium wilhelmae]MDP9800657.1 phosphate transport system substrate-binding protein [Arcanobacterium wilhelmae]WFN90060.1 phosphate ABC transporter substrate-binding protein PstS [Arcanobacterium wilhelmae]
MMNLSVKARASVAVVALTALLGACGTPSVGSLSNSGGSAAASGAAAAKGTLNGSGASSQVNAQQAWRDTFTKNTGIRVNYDSTGSGTGRQQFIAGQVAFAGTDSLLKEDELAKAAERCGSEPLELPLYISPIAVAFNLPGVKELNLDAETIAKIFAGKIATWNDPAIAAQNEGVNLPDLPVIPVNRADDSGTTKNFQQYLAQAAPKEWTAKPSDVWPIKGTQSAEQTSGVIELTKSTEGAVTYADASQVGELGTVKVKVAGEYLAYSPEAAAKIVDGSPLTKDATDRRVTFDLKRDGSVAGAYPIVLVSYLVACTSYPNAGDAANVKSYFEYMASKEGQEVAAKADGGNAPISDSLREKVNAAIALIGK